MRLRNPTKLELFIDGFRYICSALEHRNQTDDWSRNVAFWQDLNAGWYDMEHYPLVQALEAVYSKLLNCSLNKEVNTALRSNLWDLYD